MAKSVKEQERRKKIAREVQKKEREILGKISTNTKSKETGVTRKFMKRGVRQFFKGILLIFE